MPARAAARHSIAICAMPATHTPQTSAGPGSPPVAPDSASAPSRMTFSSTGAAAAAANLSMAFSTPDSSAAMEMNRM